MAGFGEWIDLAGSTFRNLKSRDVTDLYDLELPEAVQSLTADHREQIQREPSSVKRGLRVGSAVMYGLTKRLAPQRRLMFLCAHLFALLAIFHLVTSDGGLSARVLITIYLPVLLLTVLLGMEMIDKIKFRDELELARDLQASLIPAVPPEFPGYEIRAMNRIANTVGGDIYDFVPLEDGRLAILFGDASGHGMQAGLVMAVAHAAFRTQLPIDPSPAAIIGSLNRILCSTGGPRSFLACCYLLISPDGQYEATLAGHPQLLQLEPSGSVSRRVGQGAYPLGIRGERSWETQQGVVNPGEFLLLHSDGLPEMCDANGGVFGYERVETTVSRACPQSAADLLARLVIEGDLFAGGRKPDDDVSIAVIRRV